MDSETYNQIIKKKEFSELPKTDVEKAYSHFEKRQTSEEEKIRLTRDLLRKVFSVFTSKKILSLKDKEPSWILRKHLSTRERIPYYTEIYERILKDFKGSILDLGAGINGFSYEFFPRVENYVAIEAMGQLVNLMNHYFKGKGIHAKAIHMSLFELDNLFKEIDKIKEPRVIFLFKVLDSLEMLERDYSKQLLLELAPLAERIVVSFATESIIKRTKFKANRNWILNFISENFQILDDFNLGSERYVVFRKSL